MDVTDFLEFEGTFEGYGITVSSSEEEEVACIGERATEVGNAVVELQHLFHLCRYLVQFSHHCLVFIPADGATLVGECQCKH